LSGTRQYPQAISAVKRWKEHCSERDGNTNGRAVFNLLLIGIIIRRDARAGNLMSFPHPAGNQAISHFTFSSHKMDLDIKPA